MQYKLPFLVEIPVRFGDIDALGHVNNVTYFRYLEQARVYFMEKVKGLTGNAAQDFPYVVVHAELDYMWQMRYTDTCVITMGISHVGNSSFTFAYELFSKNHNQMAAKGKVTLVALDHKTGKKILLPDEFKKQISDYVVNNWE